MKAGQSADDYIFGADVGLAKIYYQKHGRYNLRTTSSKGDGYVWSREQRLWVSSPKEHIQNMIGNKILENVISPRL